MNKILVVGAGLSGATLARLCAENGNDVVVVDKRSTVGGNVYDTKDKNGITVQLYGPHIFHTNNKRVFDFLSRFTEWEKYEHKVTAKIKGELVPVPFNLTSLYKLYPKEKADEIERILTSEIGKNKKVPILQLKNHPNKQIREFAQFVYDNVFYKYTKKQWGMKPEQLGENVMNRVPVYLSYEDRYFTDEFQFMPKNGFTCLVENLLAHPNITTKLKTEASKVLTFNNGKIYLYGKEFEGYVVYTGRIDELFDYKLGVLPYRSLDFEFKTKSKSSYQPTAVVNYTVSRPYTRISEFSKFACPPQKKTVIVKEYSKKCSKKDIPYYPIPIQKNYDLYKEYRTLAEEFPNLKLLGRLANYKYINMDVAVEDAIKLFEENSFL